MVILQYETLRIKVTLGDGEPELNW
jgi:hypothetical protein